MQSTQQAPASSDGATSSTDRTGFQETHALAKDISQGKACSVRHLLKVNEPLLAAAGLATCFLTGWRANVPLPLSETVDSFMDFQTFLLFVSRKFCMHSQLLCRVFAVSGQASASCLISLFYLSHARLLAMDMVILILDFLRQPRFQKFWTLAWSC